MCEITNELSETKIGYKVIAVENGKFYSTFSGQEYVIGKVPESPVLPIRLSTHWVEHNIYFKLPGAMHFRKDFCGKTASFIKMEDAEKLLYGIHDGMIYDQYQAHIAKIEYTGKIYKGEYRGSGIIAGSVIKNITLI